MTNAAASTTSSAPLARPLFRMRLRRWWALYRVRSQLARVSIAKYREARARARLFRTEEEWIKRTEKLQTIESAIQTDAQLTAKDRAARRRAHRKAMQLKGRSR